jgi:hypothetical protein
LNKEMAMEYQDIIPEGLEGKTEAERQKIIERWEELYDLKRAILEEKKPEARSRLPEIESELSRLGKQLEPREVAPETGILLKGERRYILCPRCGTFVQITRERVSQLAVEFKETPREQQAKDKYLIKSITCPVCKWGLGIPEDLLA